MDTEDTEEGMEEDMEDTEDTVDTAVTVDEDGAATEDGKFTSIHINSLDYLFFRRNWG